MLKSQVSSVLTQSRSFPGSGKLPFDLPPEPEEGNIEYKLINPTADRLEHLMTQMKWRLNEGGGQAIYRLGVDDCGSVTGLTAREMSASLRTIYRMAEKLGVNICLLRECTLSSPDGSSASSPQRKAIELQAKWKVSINQGIPDMRVAMLGSVDVGKSTLLGILTEGIMDDGRGRARLNIFCHLHEVQSGRTSSLSSEVIGFDTSGRLINRRCSKEQLNKRTFDEVIRDSNRLITLIDLAGHFKYQRTTFAGLTTYQPTFCLFVVSATTGLSVDGLSHARTAAALGLPIAVVISKVDLVLDTPYIGAQSKMSAASVVEFHDGEDVYSSVIADLRRKIIEDLKTIKIYTTGADGISPKATGCSCYGEDMPVFAVSCVSGYGMNNFLNFLHEVSNPHQDILVSTSVLRTPPLSNDVQSTLNKGFVECWVTRVFSNVPGAGNPVLEIVVRNGQVHNGQRLWLGPDEEGQFYPVRVIELRHNRHPHHVLFKDQVGSLLAVGESISDGSGNFPAPRRGMVMVNAPPTTSSTSHQPSISVCWSFSISNLVWVGPGASRACLQPNSIVGIHTGNVMQYARVIKSTLTPGQLVSTVDYFKGNSNSVILQLDPSHRLFVAFLRHPEFLELGRQVIISRNNVVNIVGRVAGFEHAITFFSDTILSQSSSLGHPYTTNSSHINCTATPWNDVSDSFDEDTSYETLLSQIGIDPKGPGTHFIGEPPPSPKLSAQNDASTLHQARKRRQRAAKKHRKAEARLAYMNAMASPQSSISTLNSCDNNSVRAIQKNQLVSVDEIVEREGDQMKTNAGRHRRRRKKRKTKR
nr:gtp binding protein 2 [Hymenolepis microstoma]